MTINFINRMIGERDLQLVAVAMDSKTKSFRKDIDPQYKATRPPAPEDLPIQLTRTRSLLELMGIKVWNREGFEADDIIASAVRIASREGLRSVIVSADKDLLQLVSSDVLMWDTMRNRVFGPKEVVEKYGVQPSQMRDLLALVGDSSDNIKGVPSVGRKRAAVLLNQYGSIEGIYKSIRQIKGVVRQNLDTHRDVADLARKLVSLRDDLEIEFDRTELEFRRHQNLSGFQAACQDLGFDMHRMGMNWRDLPDEESKRESRSRSTDDASQLGIFGL